VLSDNISAKALFTVGLFLSGIITIGLTGQLSQSSFLEGGRGGDAFWGGGCSFCTDELWVLEQFKIK